MQFGSPIGIGAGIAGIVQDAQRQATGQSGRQSSSPLWGPLMGRVRKLDALAIEVLDDADRAAEFGEHLKKQLDRLLNLTIRIKGDLPGLGIHKPDGQLGAQLAARRFA